MLAAQAKELLSVIASAIKFDLTSYGQFELNLKNKP